MDEINPQNTTGDFRDLFRELRSILRADGLNSEKRLQAIVDLISVQLNSEVCSLYQTDNTKNILILKATKGLRPEAVGRTALKFGEGLVGTIAKIEKPLALENAQEDERFSFRPEIYQSFLGVPLIRSNVLIGVLVFQHRERRQYSVEEIEDCETVAQFLSEMLHQTSLTLNKDWEISTQESLQIKAVPISPGLAIGIVVFHLKDTIISRWRSDNQAQEQERLEIALESLETALLALRQAPDGNEDLATKELLETDLMFARDKGWRRKIEMAILQGLSAEAAVQTVREDIRARMKDVRDDYIRERLMDLDELSHRLLAKLTGEELHQMLSTLPPNSILVCRSLAAAELLQAGRENLAGLVIVDATPSSHLAIIANSLKIPALGQVPEALTDLHDGDLIILDAINGQIIAQPSESILVDFKAHITKRIKIEAQERETSYGPCISRDGIHMHVYANAGLLLDFEEIVQLKTDGIGLYRTEVAFMIRDDFPSVEEQAQLYRRIYDHMDGKPVVFRTLDVGSDKKLPYFKDSRKEPNPALGWRAIRIGLDHPELLCDQLRALLMAAENRELRVMFPMITEAEEFEAARSLLMGELKQHQDRGRAAPSKLHVGFMIEVPALLWELDRLFELADFASVGTNDLFQFLNAADRNNPNTDTRYDMLKPANLRILKMIAESANRAGKPVSICGEFAGTPLGAIALIGCGFRAFSMNSSQITQIRSLIHALDVAKVEEKIDALSAQSSGNIRAPITALAKEFGIDIH